MLAIIPARGSSKGLPGKNIKMLNGKPLIAYTIEAALAAKSISRVIVSTDSEKIAAAAISYGAECPFLRPDHLADDTATSNDVFLHAIEKVKMDEKIEISEFMVLQPTSPLRDYEDIDNAVKLFKEKKADAIISYCKEYHPIRWHKYLDGEGRLVDIFGEVGKIRQEERSSYFPNGAIYIYTTDYLRSGKGNSFAFLMPRTKSIDIDTLEDFRYCEFLMSSK